MSIDTVQRNQTHQKQSTLDTIQLEAENMEYQKKKNTEQTNKSVQEDHTVREDASFFVRLELLVMKLDFPIGSVQDSAQQGILAKKVHLNQKSVHAILIQRLEMINAFPAIMIYLTVVRDVETAENVVVHILD